MTHRFSFLLALLFVAASVRAQTDVPSQKPARFQLYGGYALLSNSFNGLPGARHPLNGWDSSIAFPLWHNLRFKIDASGYLGTNTGASQRSLFVAAGGQFFHRFGRESAFLEGLIAPNSGDLGRYWGPNGAPGETATFAAILGGGIDTPISPRFAIRVSGAYQWTNLKLINNVQQIEPIQTPGLPNNFARVSSGLVWNF
jgi:hypothetical protein